MSSKADMDLASSGPSWPMPSSLRYRPGSRERSTTRVAQWVQSGGSDDVDRRARTGEDGRGRRRAGRRFSGGTVERAPVSQMSTCNGPHPCALVRPLVAFRHRRARESRGPRSDARRVPGHEVPRRRVWAHSGLALVAGRARWPTSRSPGGRRRRSLTVSATSS